MKITYCIATYRRPEKLRNTLLSILQQDDAAVDVVVGDNDPQGSAESVVAALASTKVGYHRNAQNLGMVGNFNSALARATGDYVVMITDDDPVTLDHAQTLRALASCFPGQGAYFCLGQSFTEKPDLARHYRIAVGRAMRPMSLSARQYGARGFVLAFLRGQIPGYMLWSCGMVRRDIAQRVTMPDYGTPYLTDFAYIALAAGDEGVVIQDKIIGWQEIHADNFGRKELAEISTAVNGFRGLMHRRWPGDHEISRASERFLARWVGGHFGFMLRYGDGASTKLATAVQYARLMNQERLHSGVGAFAVSVLPLPVYRALRTAKRSLRG